MSTSTETVHRPHHHCTSCGTVDGYTAGHPGIDRDASCRENITTADGGPSTCGGFIETFG